MIDAIQRRRTVLERLAHLERALASICKHPESLTSGADRLAKSVQTVLTIAAQTFDEQWKELDVVGDKGKNEDQKIRMCSDYNDVLSQIGTELIPVLDGARPEHIPFELEPVLSKELRKAADEWRIDSLVLSSQYRYNYTVKLYDFQGLYGQLRLGAMPPGLPRQFLLVRIPRMERDSIPLHAVLLGHELGHLRAWRSDILEEIEDDVRLSLRAEMKTAQDVRRIQEIVHCVRSWSEEYMSDIFSALTLGPAALLSLSELALTLAPIDFRTKSHPSPGGRLKIMLRVLQRSGFDRHEDTKGVWELYSAMSQSTASRNPIPGSLLATIENETGKYLDAMMASCIAAVPQDEQFRSDRWDEVREAERFLETGLPFGEVLLGQGLAGVQAAVILNAAWTIKMHGNHILAQVLQSDPEQEPDVVRCNEILDGLVLKSLEISEYRSNTPWP